MGKDKYEILKELTGIGTTSLKQDERRQNVTQLATRRQSRNNQLPRDPAGEGGGTIPLGSHGFNLSHCKRMHGWQTEVAQKLSNGQSVYVVASPGGGKTMPMICYWAQDILKLNVNNLNANKLADMDIPVITLMTSPEKIKKLMIMVPVRSLNKTTQEDFISHFSHLIAQSLEYAMFHSENSQLQSIVFDKLSHYDSKIRQVNSRRDALYRDYARANDVNDRKTMDRIKKEYQSIHKSLNTRLVDAGRKFIEAELIAYALEGSKSSSTTFKRAPVHICIYESAVSAFKKHKRQYDLVVCDEAHLVQQEDVPSERTSNIAKALYTILDNMDSSSKILFLSGTVNINAARELAMYIRRCFLKTIYVMDEAKAGNKADVGVAAADWVRDENKLVDITASPKDNGNLIIVFSKKTISRIVEKALKRTGRLTPNQVDKGGYDRFKSPFSKRAKLMDSLKTTEVTKKLTLDPDLAKRMSKLPGASNITNPVTLQCVLAGFGYVYRDVADNIDTPFHLPSMTDAERLEDNAIVGNLFARGKLRTLLATDAVGIGVNISVKRCYIPSIMKPDGSTLKQIRMAQLSQLLNRTGRNAFDVANIYAHTDDVQTITQALNMGSGDFEQNATVIMPKGICRTYSWFEKLYKRAVGIPIIK